MGGPAARCPARPERILRTIPTGSSLNDEKPHLKAGEHDEICSSYQFELFW